MTRIDLVAWQTQLKTSVDHILLETLLKNITWTSKLANEWQEFYDTAQQVVVLYQQGQIKSYTLPHLPKYQDLPNELCSR